MKINSETKYCQTCNIPYINQHYSHAYPATEIGVHFIKKEVTVE